MQIIMSSNIPVEYVSFLNRSIQPVNGSVTGAESGYGGVHTFLKGISPNVNVIAHLEFEFAYEEFEV